MWLPLSKYDFYTLHQSFSNSSWQGISRFWQLDLKSDQHWSYSKQENITEFSNFHYCISETPSLPGFSVIATANGFQPSMLFFNAVRVPFCCMLLCCVLERLMRCSGEAGYFRAQTYSWSRFERWWRKIALLFMTAAAAFHGYCFLPLSNMDKNSSSVVVSWQMV